MEAQDKGLTIWTVFQSDWAHKEVQSWRVRHASRHVCGRMYFCRSAAWTYVFIFVCTAELLVVIFLCDCVTIRELADEYGGGFAQRERTARLELLRN